MGPFENLKIRMFQLHINVEALGKEYNVKGKKYGKAIFVYNLEDTKRSPCKNIPG